MKVSLIIPCYNVERYLGECLDSVVSAVVRLPLDADLSVEVIAVDDGSTDSTGKMLDKWQNSTPELSAVENFQFNVIHQSNGGEGAARNAAMDAMTGDWFMFLDSDDVLKSSVFQTISLFLKNDVDLIRYRAENFYEDEPMCWSEQVCAPQSFDLGVELPPTLADVGFWRMVYKASTFGDLRFGRYKIGADLAFTSHCYVRAAKLIDTGTAEYGYRERQTSMVHKPRTPEMTIDSIDFLVETFVTFRDSDKILCDGLSRRRGNMWIEERANDVLIQGQSDEWDRVWHHWLKTLNVASTMPFFSPWQKFVIDMVRLTKSRYVAELLCAWPHRLKRKGFHR